jgi:hypothetical protein
MRLPLSRNSRNFSRGPFGLPNDLHPWDAHPGIRLGSGCLTSRLIARCGMPSLRHLLRQTIAVGIPAVRMEIEAQENHSRLSPTISNWEPHHGACRLSILTGGLKRARGPFAFCSC